MGEERWRQEFMAGLEEGFAGVPMEFPEGIRPLGEFHREYTPVGEGEEAVGPLVTPDLDDQVIDAEIVE